MTKPFIAIFTFVLAAGLLIMSPARAQQVGLPSAGVTPDSPFYFIDRFGERLRQFLTFDPEARAKLQIEFAGERVAEIKVIVESSGPEAEGIEKAQSLLIGNVAYAAQIINAEKAAGKDVARLAKDIDDEFDAREELLAQTFSEARKKLLTQRKEIKDKLLKDAQAAGDFAKVAELTRQLDDALDQADSLKKKGDEIKNDLRTEKEKIEQEMDEEDQQSDKIERSQQDQEEQEQEEKIEAEEDLETGEPTEAPEVEESSERRDNLEIDSNARQEEVGSRRQKGGAESDD